MHTCTHVHTPIHTTHTHTHHTHPYTPHTHTHHTYTDVLYIYVHTHKCAHTKSTDKMKGKHYTNVYGFKDGTGVKMKQTRME